ncbi:MULTISPECIES: hypothetical protein, partial [unclassified Bradyrhizobium]|uniref:hypothetical protein n=1 Tax=unclassified Bradyrhizobium TaxID=2631580 RepID=UPI0029168B2B
SPQQQRTRNGTTTHEGEGVHGPDAYLPTVDCKIKAARLLISKPLTWLAFNRAVRSERVSR